MGTLVICFLLAVVCVLSVRSVIKRIKYGSSCCGTHDPLPKKIRVSDRDASHYPCCYRLTVDGMHCSNCVRHVENALNSLPGVWATVSLAEKSVLVRSKSPLEEDGLSRAVSEAGYTLMDFSQCV